MVVLEGVFGLYVRRLWAMVRSQPMVVMVVDPRAQLVVEALVVESLYKQKTTTSSTSLYRLMEVRSWNNKL